MKIALVETRVNGHHLEWLCKVRDLLLSEGHEVAILYPDPEAISLAEGVEVVRGPDSYAVQRRFRWLRVYSFQRMIVLWLVLRKLKPLNVDRTCFLYWDALAMEFPGAARLAGFMLRRPWVALWFHLRERRQYGVRWRLPEMQVFRSKTCVGVGLLREDRIQELAQKLHAAVAHIPDPCWMMEVGQNESLVADVRAFANGRSVVGLVGALNRRKGIPEFLEVIQADGDRRCCYLLAGEVLDPSSYSEEERLQFKAFLEDPPANVFILNRRLSDGEFQGLFSVIDILWIAYRDFHGSSSMLARAAAHHIPVVSGADGIIAKRVRQFDLGVVVDLNQPALIAKDIQSMLDAEYDASSQFLDGCQRYCKDHSVSSFNRRVLDLILSARVSQEF